MGNTGSSVWSISPSRPLGDYFSGDPRRNSLQYWNRFSFDRQQHTSENTQRRRTDTPQNTRSISEERSTSRIPVAEGSGTSRRNTERNQRRSGSSSQLTKQRSRNEQYDASVRQIHGNTRSNLNITTDKGKNSNAKYAHASELQTIRLGEYTVSNLIRRKVLAPMESGADESSLESAEDCPICFAFYNLVNYTACCSKPICTKCFVVMRISRRRGQPSVCPFCNMIPLEIVFYGENTPHRLMQEAHKESLAGLTKHLSIQVATIQHALEEQPEIGCILSAFSDFPNSESIRSVTALFPKEISLPEGKKILVADLLKESEDKDVPSCLHGVLNPNDLSYIEAVVRSLHDICYLILREIAVHAQVEFQLSLSTTSSLRNKNRQSSSDSTLKCISNKELAGGNLIAFTDEEEIDENETRNRLSSMADKEKNFGT
eukprot:jgi/Galph1/2588/GphlegSOOS_G1241.1